MKVAQPDRVIHVMMTVNAAWNIWNFRMPLVHALLGAGHRVTILAPPDHTVPALQAAGCRFLPLELNAAGLNPFGAYRLLRQFRRVLRAERPDVVFGYTIKNNIFGAMAARPLGIAFLPNITGLGTAFLSGKALQKLAFLLYRHAFKSVPAVFFQNDEDRSFFVSRGLVGQVQARLLPGSGIDLAHFQPAPMPLEGGAPVFLMIARLLLDKGVVEYVEAARRLKAERPELIFRLLGALDAGNRSAIAAPMLQAWRDEGVIEYLGTTADVRPMIAAADCIVLPSYREGAPRTLIEAAAMARPVVATDVEGCRSVVQNGVTGLLCAPRCAVSLARSLQDFLALPHAARLAMGGHARRRMEEIYDQAHVVNACCDAICEVTGITVTRRSAYSVAGQGVAA